MNVEEQIEKLTLVIIRNIQLGNDVRIIIPKEIIEEKSARITVASFRRNKKRLAILLRVLSTIYELRSRKSFITKRDLYYEDPAYFGNQAAVDRAIDDACALLHQSRWKLNILNSSRALIFGDLVCEDMSLNSVVDFRSNSQGTILSMEPSRLKILSCNARFVLIIEKDASFQAVLDSSFYSRFAPCLILTGKGFPDSNLHRLLADLHKMDPKRPMLALMDPDPYGLKIYLIYKYNSKNMRRMDSAEETPTLASLVLLGVLVSELKTFHLRRDELMELSARDNSILQNIRNSDEYKADQQAQTEVNCFMKYGLKGEIQTLHSLGRSFLCDFYLQQKLSQLGISPLC